MSPLANRMAASTTYWENYLRERDSAADRLHSRDSYLRLLIALVATIFIATWMSSH